MTLAPLPQFAAWRHLGMRNGFEVVYLESRSDSHRVEGHVAAVEDGQPWAVQYSIVVDATWTTRSAHVHGRSASGQHQVSLENSEQSGWSVDGSPAPKLAGCADVDLEASSFTNALPVQRLRLRIDQLAEAPAAYVRAPDLAVERLEQRYQRISGEGSQQRYAYEAPRFDYSDELIYDRHGLLIDYPGIAERIV